MKFLMKRRQLLSLTAVCAALGIADAWYLAQHALTNTALSCGIGTLSGCNVVAQSAYSHFYGIPLGIYGVAFYAAVLVTALFLLLRRSARGETLLLVLGCIGVLLSMYFVGIQLFVINAICIYCFASFLLSIGIFVLSYRLVRLRTLHLHPA